MKPADRDKLIQETHQGLFGVVGTEEKGMVGDIKDIKAHQENHSKRLTVIETTDTVRKELNGGSLISKGKIATVGGGIASGIGAAIFFIGQSLKWW